MSTTARQLLEAAALSSPAAQEELDRVPELPEVLEPVWGVFRDLTGRRQSGMSANPMTYQEVQAYASLTARPLAPLEVDLLMQVDDTWMQYQFYSNATEHEQSVVDQQWAEWNDDREDDDG